MIKYTFWTPSVGVLTNNANKHEQNSAKNLFVNSGEHGTNNFDGKWIIF